MEYKYFFDVYKACVLFETHVFALQLARCVGIEDSIKLSLARSVMGGLHAEESLWKQGFSHVFYAAHRTLRYVGSASFYFEDTSEWH